MMKNNKRDNILIRRKLVEEMKKAGINRVNATSISFLDNYLLNKLRNMFRILKDELTVRGKKTLEKDDIERVLQMMNKKKEFEF